MRNIKGCQPIGGLRLYPHNLHGVMPAKEYMKTIINDIPVELNHVTATLEEALLHSGINDLKGLAVAVNNTVIPRANWNNYGLKENDKITIIRATQGG